MALSLFVCLFKLIFIKILRTNTQLLEYFWGSQKEIVTDSLINNSSPKWHIDKSTDPPTREPCPYFNMQTFRRVNKKNILTYKMPNSIITFSNSIVVEKKHFTKTVSKFLIMGFNKLYFLICIVSHYFLLGISILMIMFWSKAGAWRVICSLPKFYRNRTSTFWVNPTYFNDFFLV